MTTSEVVEHKATSDGTGAKIVVRLHDGALVETVVIGHRHASTVGATMQDELCVTRSFEIDECFGSNYTIDPSHIVSSERLVFKCQLARHYTTGATRNTVCVSTQVGCRMGCTFCETGTLGLLANLTAGEIAEQVWHARHLVGQDGIRNVVFMGMGEPLDNYEEAGARAYTQRTTHLHALPRLSALTRT